MLHVDDKRREAFGFSDEKVQEIPLRHESDEFAVSRQPREVGHRDKVTIEDSFQLRHFLMRQLQEFIQQPEFVHQLKCGRMNGVAAKIAVEIAVLLQHHDIDAGAGEQIAGQHSGWSATHDNATSADVRRRVHGIWRSMLASRSPPSPRLRRARGDVDPPNKHSCCFFERRER